MRTVAGFDLDLRVCMCVYASLSMHYLPHYIWSPTAANGARSHTRCVPECVSLCTYLLLLGEHKYLYVDSN